MKTVALRLVPTLMFVQIVVGGLVSLVAAAFAPRLLLLDDVVVGGSMPIYVGGVIAVLSLAVIVTLVLTRPVRQALRSLAAGDGNVAPQEVLTLYAVPSRLVAVNLMGAAILALFTFAAPLRPETNDLYTQAELVILALTFVSVAALPIYVIARASVGRVLELVPVEVSREAIEILESAPAGLKSVQRRMLAAVVAPVAFVALGASLLVQSHVRAFDTMSRQADAELLARGVFERVNGDTSGRLEAADEAANHGYRAEISRVPMLPFAERVHGETVLTVPLEDGHARIVFDTSRVSPSIGIFVLLSVVAIAIAGLLGMRLGAAYADDLLLATREVRALGAMDVIRGTRIPKYARFESIGALMSAIDELGAVFREFASAQERAIDARAATERMRGLFLASMSHDLKAPLNSILGFAELLSRAELTDGQKESVAIVEQRGRELLHLIDTILDTARAEAGALSISTEWTMVGDVVMPAVLDARDLTHGLDVQIVGEIQPGVPRIFVDQVRATQAITSVILVATRFADHGTIRVRATVPGAGERLRIDVETTGRGLPAEERDKIFEAFKHPDRARRHGSLGLGPSLARTIIEVHGGSIDVDTTEGGGTVFHLWLPTEHALVSLPPASR